MPKVLRNYILETDFRINYIKDKLDIINYSFIDHFDDDKIIIRYSEGIIIIKGEKLVIARLLDDEILISGKIKNIEIKLYIYLKIELKLM